MGKIIAGKTIQGSAKIEFVLAGEYPVLRIRYDDGGKSIEETCLVHSDLDNYPRISCHLYQPGLKTQNPGMEAFFIDFTE